MHEFGSAGLVTGFIKQLLATFELPTTRVYTREFEQYFEQHSKESPYVIESFKGLSTNVPTAEEGEYDNITRAKNLQVDQTLLVPYLKEGRLQFYLGGYYTTDYTFVPGKWQSDELGVDKSKGGLWNIYNRGAAYPNQTKRLQIRNNIYDSYTHEYLGNYLRFLRDYDDLDLMSLYNCFSNRLCTTESAINIDVLDKGQKYGVFNAGDPNYKIYAVPVKLFKQYTIAIDSAFPVEMCCGIYNNKLNTNSDIYKQLLKTTYKRVSEARFAQPFLYSELLKLAPPALSEFPSVSEIQRHSAARKFIAQIADRESNLVLLFKVHRSVDSSIVILEGDYCKWNNFSAKFIPATSSTEVLTEKKIQLEHNHTVIANESIFSDLALPLIAPLQLLQLNGHKFVPFADRLLEYLLDMCITGSQDEPRENVLMAQYLTSLYYKGESMTTRYYIIKNTDKSQEKILYLDRAFCSTSGDWYIKSNDGVQQNERRVYQCSPEGVDILVGSLQSLKQQGWQWKDTVHTTKPQALEQNLLNGVWHPSLRKLFYDYMLNETDHNFVAHRDILGYVDKDVEKYFAVPQVEKKTNRRFKKTMFNFNIWEDIKE
jgi:hypothetical protein